MGKNKYVFFSQLGFTDPVRDSSEGPMLHIIRKYAPEKVYLFMTQEVYNNHLKDNRYVSAIKRQAENQNRDVPDIEMFDEGRDIDDPSDYDIFLDLFYMLVKRVMETHPDSIILVNASSGTPQMLGALCMVGITLGGNIKMIQVKTPKKGANYAIDKYSEEDAIEVYENIGEVEDRCSETKVNDFRKSILSAKVKELLDSYNYNAALSLLKENSKTFSNEALRLASFAVKKSIWDYKSADTDLPEYAIRYCPIKTNEPRIRAIVEYYLTIRLEESRKDFANMVLKLSPILTAIATEIIINKFGFDLEKVIENERLIRQKIYYTNKDLLDYIERMGQLKSADYVNLSYIINMLKYFMESDSRYSKYSEQVGYLEELREVEKDVRHKAAHKMVINSEKMFEKVGSYKEFLAKLDRLVFLLYSDSLKEGWRNVYKDINKEIIELL